MGLRGELFSTKVMMQNRTYFFNIKENRMGDLYLNIVESKNRDEGGFDRQSVILFADDLQEFLKGFDESLRVLEKEIRERRRSARTAARDAKGDFGEGRAERGHRFEKHDKFEKYARPEHSRGERSDRGDRSEKRGGYGSAEKRGGYGSGEKRGGYRSSGGGKPSHTDRPRKGPPKEGRRVTIRKRRED